MDLVVSVTPIRAVMSSIEIEPGRKMVGVWTMDTTVDSMPFSDGPPSITITLPKNSSSTCCAVVGETWPDTFADGAEIGVSNAANNILATGWDGQRIAIVSKPPQADFGTDCFLGSTIVSGPGQNCSASMLHCLLQWSVS